MAEADTIRCLMVPVGEGRWLVPGALVAEVIDYREPGEAPADAPPWLAGFVAWRGRQIPTLRPEVLAGEAPSAGGEARLLVLKAVTGRLAEHAMPSSPRVSPAW
ncbi:MAG: chemotaxis protein CheW [Arhodomonas sp.]|nr:chemotaxis protein CheW [Arhodomonas sp.]